MIDLSHIHSSLLGCRRFLYPDGIDIAVPVSNGIATMKLSGGYPVYFKLLDVNGQVKLELKRNKELT